MTSNRYNVVAIGNAIVDVIVKIEDSFLQQFGLTKGAMTLINAKTAEKLQRSISSTKELSGGSAANTVAGIAGLGGKAAFIGKVGGDKLGEAFSHSLSGIGVPFLSDSNYSEVPTARSFVFVTPDAERTMQTFLGACSELTPNDINPELIANSDIVYLEGYLWDPPKAKNALVKAARVAKTYGRKTSLSLSDSFCVKRHREEFIDFIKRYVDILFANEDEIKSLFSVQSFEEAAEKIRDDCDISVITRGSSGSAVISGNETIFCAAQPVKKVVDTTGAGDAYAAGFLYGYTQEKNLSTSAKIGSVIASEVISHFGARPETDLYQLLTKHFAGKL